MIEPLLIHDYPNDLFFEQQRLIGNHEIFCLLKVRGHTILYLFDCNKSVYGNYFFKFCSVIYDKSNNRDYFVNASRDMTRDKFVNCILSEYPKYAEWMLYHPEWLA